MHRIRRITALALCLSILASFICVPVSAASDQIFTPLLKEDFSSLGSQWTQMETNPKTGGGTGTS